MTPPKIQALGVTQEGSPTRWKATGYVEGIGWLEAWGISLITAMKALQALAAQRLAETDEGIRGRAAPHANDQSPATPSPTSPPGRPLLPR
jgi:hypothetical protein